MEKEMNVSVPAVMNAMQVAKYLGISKQGAYNLMNSESFEESYRLTIYGSANIFNSYFFKYL